jgi:transcriptional regulator with XRE-family HTH domain
MKNTRDFLQEAKRKNGLESDYALAKLLGISRQRISHYTTGKETLSDEVARRVAAALDYPPAYVMACVHAERAKEKELRKIWEQAAKVLGGMAAAVVLAVALLPMAPALEFDNPQITRNDSANYLTEIYIMRSFRRGFSKPS